MAFRKINPILALFFALLLTLSVALPTPQDDSSAPSKAVGQVTDATCNGEKLEGATFTVDKFIGGEGNDLKAAGLLTATCAGKSISETITLPVQSINGKPSSSGLSRRQLSCSILDLVLGPLDLNLLGLVLNLNQVLLTLEAVPGAGALLGNLLCAVTNLLNGGALLGGLAGALNGILNGLLGIFG
ncbi:hypothetical protein HK097_009368 [Rhizophlyctis rosea]|uniref:Uncharacterized protein n=1 Tax=Rhizophlyctis rosea TaxID=64517 RepID=A0AAD5SAM4_9FUNG|nr:hypothetical protein HK097_009368 [Rhizophlyctis rosea]